MNLSESEFKEIVAAKCSQDETRPTTEGTGEPRRLKGSMDSAAGAVADAGDAAQ